MNVHSRNLCNGLPLPIRLLLSRKENGDIQTPPPMKKTGTKQTIAYFSAFFILGAVIASLGPTLPGLAGQVGRHVSSLGILFSTRSFGYLFGSLFAGWVLDRMRGHIFLVVVATWLAMLLFAIPLQPSLFLLGSSLFLIGVGLGSIDVSSNSLLAHVHKEESGPYLNAMYLAAGVGSFLLPLYLGSVSLSTGYSTLALLNLPLILWLAVTPSPQVPGNENGELQLETDIAVILLFACMAFLVVGIEVSYGGWVFTYFIEQNLGDQNSAYLINSLFWMAITLGRLIAIPFATRIRPLHSILMYLTGGFLSSGLILAFQDQAWAAWVGSAGIGLSLATLFPTTFNYIQRSNSISNPWNGIVWSIGSAGGILLPLVIGWSVRTYAPPSMMFIIFSAWIAALITFFLLLFKNQDVHRLFVSKD